MQILRMSRFEPNGKNTNYMGLKLECLHMTYVQMITETIQVSSKVDRSAPNINWVNVLMISSYTYYALNEHEYVGQYGPYAIPSR